ncbi:ATP/GTP-binding protein [Streptomyces sp. NPDC058373]|uniref:ATP/GTP-binding protein n=1 Tax=Streptomyces sp. NPDC058373 TaxID=3346465 RepID=UPI00366649F5
MAEGPGGGVQCPPTKLDCDLSATDPGSGGDNKPGKPADDGGSGGGGSKGCDIDGEKVPCSSELGQFNAADSCYWRVLDPQPTDPARYEHAAGVPDGWEPGDPGKLYNVTCPGAERQLMGGLTFSEEGPEGPAVDPEVLAREAMEKLTLRPPSIASPRGDGKYLVGMPMWMWVDRSASTWGPTSESASAGGVTVTATATVDRLVWKMGDGTSVTCNDPGTPYTKDQGMKASPTCGHRYEKPGGHTVEVTAHWDVDWEVTSGGADSGTLTTTRSNEAAVNLHEAKALNTR